MNKIIKTVKKKEDKSFDSCALRRANANIEVYSPEELAHFGVLGMRWGVRNGGSAHQRNIDSGNTTRSAHQKNIDSGKTFRSAHQKALDEKKEERSLNRAGLKAISLANKKYFDVYNAMADESTKFYAEINSKPAYKGKKIPFDNDNPLTKKYMAECAKAATESLQRNSDRILGNKIDSRFVVKWEMGSDLGAMPSFYVDRADDGVKHSEDISDDRINLVIKINDLGQIESISLPEGSEDEFISEE